MKAILSPNSKNHSVQAKARLGPVDDKFEKQADRVAQEIVTMPADQLQRKCDSCQQGSALTTQNRLADHPISPDPGVPPLGSGQQLSSNIRHYFEPRFNSDFGHVRIHRDQTTARYADSINARAFTYGNHIGFAAGTYNESQGGKKLLAHELTHVIQQGGNSGITHNIQREVSSRSRCTGGANGAPPSPELFLGLTEMLAGSAITLANIGLTFDIQSLEAGNRPASSSSFKAYLARFGLPEQLSNQRYRDRFSGSRFATEDEAIIAELTQLKSRLESIQTFLSGSNIYVCASETANLNVGNCTDSCGSAFAWVCHTGGAPRTLVICPAFWAMSGNDRSVGLTHEVAHLVFGFGDPPGSSMTTRLRGRNPVCYSGFLASVSGRDPPDADCPTLP